MIRMIHNFILCVEARNGVFMKLCSRGFMACLSSGDSWGELEKTVFSECEFTMSRHCPESWANSSEQQSFSALMRFMFQWWVG